MAKFSMCRQVQLFLKSQDISSTVKMGKHTKVLFEVNGHKLMYTCGKTVSDVRAVANARADLRCMLRDAGVTLT